MKKNIKKMIVVIAASVMVFGCTTAVFAGSGAVNIVGNSGAGTKNTGASAVSATSSSSASSATSSSGQSTSTSVSTSSAATGTSATSTTGAGTDVDAKDSAPAGSAASYNTGTNVTTVKAANTGYGDQILPYVELFAAAFLLLAGFMHLRLNQLRANHNEDLMAKRQNSAK
uniref:hypothetical protein n=1 Tax=Eubacterium cellulosolvens TaxID=29322 RepID=UPI00048955C5|nr:hypothetical protein [[Eubacterium] cellulosolvens]